MAVRTGDGSMRSGERKMRLRVIELRQVVPVLGRVAGFAAEWLAGCAVRGHALCKFSVMDVVVTGCARDGSEVEGDQLRVGGGLVAAVAGDGHVSASEWERRLLVRGEGEV